MRRLLCWIGLHRWYTLYYDSGLGMIHHCRYCYKRKVTSHYR